MITRQEDYIAGAIPSEHSSSDTIARRWHKRSRQRPDDLLICVTLLRPAELVIFHAGQKTLDNTSNKSDLEGRR